MKNYNWKILYTKTVLVVCTCTPQMFIYIYIKKTHVFTNACLTDVNSFPFQYVPFWRCYFLFRCWFVFRGIPLEYHQFLNSSPPYLVSSSFISSPYTTSMCLQKHVPVKLSSCVWQCRATDLWLRFQGLLYSSSPDGRHHFFLPGRLLTFFLLRMLLSSLLM